MPAFQFPVYLFVWSKICSPLQGNGISFYNNNNDDIMQSELVIQKIYIQQRCNVIFSDGIRPTFDHES